MIIVSRTKSWDKLLLVDFKLKTILPYVSNSKDKLLIIQYVTNYVKDNYEKARIIWKNFRKIGAYIIDNGELDLLYIDDKYQNKGIGGKVFKRIRKKVKVIKVRRKNKRAISFYERFGYKVKNKEGDIWYLKEEV